MLGLGGQSDGFMTERLSLDMNGIEQVIEGDHSGVALLAWREIG